MIDITYETAPLHILLVDDHPLFVDGFKHMLAQLRPHVSVQVALNFSSALQILDSEAVFDIVLLDMGLPDVDGYAAIQTIRGHYPLQPLVVLSANEEKQLINLALAEGVQGYIPKSTRSEVMIGALNLVLAGGIYIPKIALSMGEQRGQSINAIPAPIRIKQPQRSDGIRELLTPRQITILENLANGLSNKEIARELNIADGTVRVHMSTIYRILGVDNRTQAVVKASKLGLTAA
ncbi:MAG: response regulator transcription factor [Pseudomonadales bacterium]|nr:response regulator transcription factor [Pseudomonadales bacterium]